MKPKTIVIAVGGNSLIADPNVVTVASQYEAARKTAIHIVALADAGYRIILAHGNGPQVGFILRRSEFSRKILHTVPLDSCVADTQGAIGYNMQMAIYNEAMKRGISVPAATIVTQVEVSPDDPSFKNPTKPIGSFMNKEDAEYHRDVDGWHIMEDAGRGYRRVVPSPKPLRIVETGVIQELSSRNILVIAAGGGGIPVMQAKNGLLKGSEAVIDKDLASALLARDIAADIFLISTAVEKVCINFNSPDQKELDILTCSEALKYRDEGQFAPGSMLPKIDAVVDFVTKTGKRAIITDPAHIMEAVAGNAGTTIMP